jgi:hypothetical protein
MRKLSWIFALAFVAYACDTEDITPMDGADALGKNSSDAKRNNVNATAKLDYTSLASSESNGVFTITLDQTGRYAVSHLLLQFVDCDGAYLDASAVTSATVNGEEWTVDSTTGSGTDCHFNNGMSFIKLDNISVTEANVVVALTFNTQVDGGSVLVKAGPTCSAPLAVTASNCQDDEKCYEWKGETAYAGNTAGLGSAWWFYFDGSGSQKIYAGQKEVAGANVKLENGSIVITLGDNMKLQADDEAVKILGYNELPSERPASGGGPGSARIYAGTDLTVSVAPYTYYVVHLDAEVKTEVACPVN